MPSAVLSNIAPTALFVVSLSKMAPFSPIQSSAPKKTWYDHLYSLFWPRYVCHGQSVETTGVPLASHCSTTGVVPCPGWRPPSSCPLGVVDEVAGYLGRPVGVRLAVRHRDADGVILTVTEDHAGTDGFFPTVHAILVGDTEGGEATGERGDEPELDLAAGGGGGADRGGRRRQSWSALPLVAVVAAVVVVVVPPQAATRPPRPAPTPIVAPAMPAILRKSRRLTGLPCKRTRLVLIVVFHI